MPPSRIPKSDTVTQKKSQGKGNKTGKGNGRSSSGRSGKTKHILHALGLFLIVLSLFLGIAFISYLGNWKSDDPLFSYSFWEIITRSDLLAVNLMGKLGAIAAYYLIKKGFGIASFLILILLFFVGFKLLFRKSRIPVWKTFRYVLVGLLWIPVALAFFLPDYMDGILAGVFGIYLNQWLETYLGKPGTGLLLFLVLALFLLLTGFFSLFGWIRLPSWISGNEPLRPASDNRISEPDQKETSAGMDNQSHPSDEQSDKNKLNSGNRTGRPSETPIDITRTREKEISFQPPDAQQDIHGGTLDHPPQTTVTPIARETPVMPPSEPSPITQGEVELIIENVPELNKSINNGGQGRISGSSGTSRPHYTVDTLYDPRLDLPDYKFPSLDLLNDYGSERLKVRNEELQENKEKIIKTLNNYGIVIDQIKATIGPTVTLYEIVPSPGVRISKIRNLEDDIALSLSAFGIRIIAPIPGKGTIGIEVPNQFPDLVSMKSVLSSEKFINSTADLPFAMGKTIANEVFVADLAKMPHILMAGATGQGKSVGLNAIITSLLYKKHPAELKFVMVDPKKVELTLFSKIERHYLAKLPDAEEAIITDTRKVVRTLNSLGIEMDTRYELLKDAQVRNIKEYNAKFLQRQLNPQDGHHFLPYIVLVIDEFADLIMTAGKEIEIPLTRLAQLARAVGIHLVIATQRPSVNIITGSIKANFPARIAFRVISKVDSRTILDTQGADQLVGRGDMLLLTGSDLIRIQCAFIDTSEIERLTEFIGSQRGYPDAYHLPEYLDENDEPPVDFDPSETDPLFEESARIIVQTQQGSTSLLQRKLKIGYNRAGRIVDQLEAAGIVGPFEGSKAREVLIKTEEELEQFLRNFNQKSNSKKS